MVGVFFKKKPAIVSHIISIVSQTSGPGLRNSELYASVNLGNKKTVISPRNDFCHVL